MEQRTMYRIVGVLADGSRIVLWKHLSHADARQLKTAWRDKLYQDVVIEAQPADALPEDVRSDHFP